MLEIGYGALYTLAFHGNDVIRNGRRLFQTSGKPTDAVLLHFLHIRVAVTCIIIRLGTIDTGTVLECLDTTWMIGAEGREIVHLWEGQSVPVSRNGRDLRKRVSLTIAMNRYP